MCNAVKNVFSKIDDAVRDTFRSADDLGRALITGDLSAAEDSIKATARAVDDTARASNVLLNPIIAGETNLKEFGRTVDQDIRTQVVNPVTDKLTNASGQAANAEKIANATIAAGEAQTAAQLAAMNAAARAAADAARLAADRDKAAKSAKAQELASPDVAIDDVGTSSSAGAIRRRRAVFGRNYATGVKI